MSPTSVRVLIVEDEMVIAARISLHLEQLGYTVAGILPRGEEAVLHCRKSPPDLLLLDVHIAGELDGIDTARVLQKEGIHVPIIYLTANSDPATFDRAKRTGPHAFLSKPYRKQELGRAIELAVLASRPGGGEPPDDAHLLTDRIFVRHKNQMVKIFLRDILYVEAERAYCKIVSASTEYLLSIALGRLAEKMAADDFLRVHRSFLINLRHIDAIAENHVVVGDRAIPIGKSHRTDFLRRVNLIR